MDANNSWRCHFKYLQNEFQPAQFINLYLVWSVQGLSRLGQPFQLILICVFLFLLNVTFYSENGYKMWSFH